MRRHWFLWLILLVYAGYLLWPQLRSALGMGSAIGAEVPAFEVQDIQGRSFASRALQGQVVLINFWATWCPPCRTEMPGFQNVYEQLHGRGLEILAISVDEDDPQGVAQFAAELGLTFPVINGQARIARAFDGGGVVPTSYLVDRQGHIRHRYVGAVNEQQLRTDVAALLKAPAAEHR